MPGIATARSLYDEQSRLPARLLVVLRAPLRRSRKVGRRTGAGRGRDRTDERAGRIPEEHQGDVGDVDALVGEHLRVEQELAPVGRGVLGFGTPGLVVEDTHTAVRELDAVDRAGDVDARDRRPDLALESVGHHLDLGRSLDLEVVAQRRAGSLAELDAVDPLVELGLQCRGLLGVDGPGALDGALVGIECEEVLEDAVNEGAREQHRVRSRPPPLRVREPIRQRALDEGVDRARGPDRGQPGGTAVVDDHVDGLLLGHPTPDLSLGSCPAAALRA